MFVNMSNDDEELEYIALVMWEDVSASSSTESVYVRCKVCEKEDQERSGSPMSSDGQYSAQYKPKFCVKLYLFPHFYFHSS